MPLDRARRNVVVLACCQALFITSSALLITIGGLVGYALAADKGLATLPVSTVVVGTALATVPASMLMRRIGRRAGFMVGALLAVAGAGVAAYAVYAESFAAFCVGSSMMGAYHGFAQYYRFAAADAASEAFKSRAISLVMAGGVVAAFAGPQLAKLSRDWFEPVTYMGCYVLLVALAVLAMLLLALVDIPPLSASERASSGRPLPLVARQPTFLVAASGGMVGYGVMSLLMTATPLAMVGHAHAFGDAALVIQWHVVGMFAPSFVTGGLIRRFGVLKVMLWGSALLLASGAVALSGLEVVHFWSALFLLGVGWNFLFIGATTLLTEVHSAAERAKVQATNDFLVFGTVAVASLGSGQLLHYLGWQAVVLWSFPFVGLSAAAIVWLAHRRRAAARAAA